MRSDPLGPTSLLCPQGLSRTADRSHTQMVLGLSPLLLAWVVLGTVLSVIDIREHRLPDRILMPMALAVLPGLGLAGLVSGDWPLSRSLVCAGLWTSAIGAVWLLSAGQAMGFGDVKLAPLVGATLGWVSWDAAVLGLVSCWLIGGCWAMGLLLLRRARRDTSIAFGPFMILGLWCGLLCGPLVLHGAL